MANNPKDKKSEKDMNLDILDALKKELIEKQISFLILTGDNTNSSLPWQHVALKEKLNTFIEVGIEVILIPGNHDIDALKKEDFASFYENFGYLTNQARILHYNNS